MVELNGNQVRKMKLLELKDKIEKLNKKLSLVIIQVGSDEASNVYVRQKKKMADELNVDLKHVVFSENITQNDLITEILKWNLDDDVDGILVQMPLPAHLDENIIQNTIDSDKDVDGLTYVNAGRLMHNNNSLIPCTPKGIVDMMDFYDINVSGKNVLVIGRSILVGKPVATLLTNRNATVTIAHSLTNNLQELCMNADIIVVAIGKAKYITSDMVKEGTIIIDAGINRIDGKLYGDVDYENVKDKCSYITPVPGGVGPMTVYELYSNVYDAHILRKRRN